MYTYIYITFKITRNSSKCYVLFMHTWHRLIRVLKSPAFSVSDWGLLGNKKRDNQIRLFWYFNSITGSNSHPNLLFVFLMTEWLTFEQRDLVQCLVWPKYFCDSSPLHFYLCLFIAPFLCLIHFFNSPKMRGIWATDDE